MFQLFALFVFFCGFSGFILSFGFFEQRLGAGNLIQPEILENRRFLLIVSILTGVLAVLKLIFVTPGDVPFIGDFLPALAGLLASVLLFTEYRNLAEERDDSQDPAFFAAMNTVFLNRRVLSGMVILVITLVHFLSPAVVLL